jgi:hypothetical protein
LKEREREVELSKFEIQSLQNTCERQARQQQETEALVVRLRADLEQANLNLRKALRA